ncbi:MAG TPA: porin, partial [Polyangiaceae bacterium]
MIRPAALLVPLALTSAVRAAPPERAPWLEDIAQRVDLYGRLDGHLAVTGDDLRVENNSSRIGFMAQQSVFGGISVLGQAEWRMSLGEGDTVYNVTENPDTGLATVDTTTNQALSTRLGFVGLRLAQFGTLTLGKQWGVYYDVSEWTDTYTVFGAHGSSTYNAGTDGGQTGEGRANDALAYRIALGALKLGVQAQFLDSRPEIVDGLSGSLTLRIGKSLRVGAAYSQSFVDFGGGVVGYDGDDAQAFTAGIAFEAGGWKVAALDTWTHNHELVRAGDAVVVYDTLGAELFVSRRFRDLVVVYGGFDFAVPRALDTRYVDPDFGTRDVLGGVRLLLDPKAGSYVYLEARTGRSRDESGEQAEDVATLGIRFNYSFRRAL